MIQRIITRMIILAMMWIGLLLLKESLSTQLLWQAFAFSAIVLLGSLMEQIFHYQGDPYILPVVEAILALGLVFVVRIEPEAHIYTGQAVHQFWWANAGLVIFYAVLWIMRDYRKLGRLRYLWGLIAVALLLVTLLFGSTAGGAKSWLNLGGITLQPEEFVKLALLIIMVWMNPWQDPNGGGYQIAQSLFAIGGGGILGTGLGNGIGASTVPAASTDFIFSVIAEELGFAGAMAVLVLFLIVVMRGFGISLRAKDRFGQILAAGIGILLGTETLIILAGVTKLLPLTGIPLPWVSYGGSSLIVHFIMLGVLLNISNATAVSAHNTKNKGKEYAI